jgi:hypothetical protein
MGMRHGWDDPHLFAVAGESVEQADDISTNTLAHEWETEKLALNRRERFRLISSLDERPPLSVA